MPERLQVTPLEASVILANEIVCRRSPSHHYIPEHYNPRVAKELYGRTWRHHYHPGSAALRPAEFSKDAERSQVLVATIMHGILPSLYDYEQMVIKLRFGLADGTLRKRGELKTPLQESYGTITYERIRRVENNALLKMRHPSRLKKLEPLLPKRP